MADETTPVKSRAWLRTLIMFAIVCVFAAVFAGISYYFVVSPMLVAEAEDVEAPEDVPGKLPAEAGTLEFPEMQATVLTEDPNEAAPILIFQVAFLCDTPHTVELVTGHMPMFTAMIQKMHRNQKRTVLNDPQRQESALKAIEQEANSLLKRITTEEELHGEILEALYLKYAIFDL